MQSASEKESGDTWREVEQEEDRRAERTTDTEEREQGL